MAAFRWQGRQRQARTGIAEGGLFLPELALPATRTCLNVSPSRINARQFLGVREELRIKIRFGSRSGEVIAVPEIVSIFHLTLPRRCYNVFAATKGRVS
jgi:hypothetical protein